MLPLDNTRAKRALRKNVVGRRAWMFYRSDTTPRLPPPLSKHWRATRAKVNPLELEMPISGFEIPPFASLASTTHTA